jgi:hypothetical protein
MHTLNAFLQRLHWQLKKTFPLQQESVDFHNHAAAARLESTLHTKRPAGRRIPQACISLSAMHIFASQSADALATTAPRLLQYAIWRARAQEQAAGRI